MPEKRTAVLICISFIILLVAGFAIYVVIGIGNGTLHFGNSNVANETFVSDRKNNSTGKWNEGVIEYQGKKYIYNSNIRSYLIMGVDREGPAVPAEDYVSGGQSDAIFLLVTNKRAQEVSVIPINRNTMTKIELCDQNGNYYGKFTAQICLQHGYGDGMKQSCLKTVNAVSALFYDIPITGYVAMNMDAMRILNRLAGGVTVEVLEDIEYGDVKLKEGETKKLTDDEAYAYLRSRDFVEFGGADRRLEREKQYALGLVEGLKKQAGGDRNKAMDMYKELEPYIVTNIVFDEIVDDLMQYGFDSSKIHEIKGESVMGKKYEEFYVDKSDLYDKIINIMYNLT